jgi:hypothetical protein
MPPPPEPGSTPLSSATLQDDPYPAVIASPPAKWTQKAARRRCKAELPCETDFIDKLMLSPISCAFSTSPSPKPVSPASPPESGTVASSHQSTEGALKNSSLTNVASCHYSGEDTTTGVLAPASSGAIAIYIYRPHQPSQSYQLSSQHKRAPQPSPALALFP